MPSTQRPDTPPAATTNPPAVAVKAPIPRQPDRNEPAASPITQVKTDPTGAARPASQNIPAQGAQEPDSRRMAEPPPIQHLAARSLPELTQVGATPPIQRAAPGRDSGTGQPDEEATGGEIASRHVGPLSPTDTPPAQPSAPPSTVDNLGLEELTLEAPAKAQPVTGKQANTTPKTAPQRSIASATATQSALAELALEAPAAESVPESVPGTTALRATEQGGAERQPVTAELTAPSLSQETQAFGRTRQARVSQTPGGRAGEPGRTAASKPKPRQDQRIQQSAPPSVGQDLLQPKVALESATGRETAKQHPSLTPRSVDAAVLQRQVPRTPVDKLTRQEYALDAPVSPEPAVAESTATMPLTAIAPPATGRSTALSIPEPSTTEGLSLDSGIRRGGAVDDLEDAIPGPTATKAAQSSLPTSAVEDLALAEPALEAPAGAQPTADGQTRATPTAESVPGTTALRATEHGGAERQPVTAELTAPSLSQETQAFGRTRQARVSQTPGGRAGEPGRTAASKPKPRQDQRIQQSAPPSVGQDLLQPKVALESATGRETAKQHPSLTPRSVDAAVLQRQVPRTPVDKLTRQEYALDAPVSPEPAVAESTATMPLTAIAPPATGRSTALSIPEPSTTEGLSLDSGIRRGGAVDDLEDAIPGPTATKAAQSSLPTSAVEDLALAEPALEAPAGAQPTADGQTRATPIPVDQPKIAEYAQEAPGAPQPATAEPIEAVALTAVDPLAIQRSPALPAIPESAELEAYRDNTVAPEPDQPVPVADKQLRVSVLAAGPDEPTPIATERLPVGLEPPGPLTPVARGSAEPTPAGGAPTASASAAPPEFADRQPAADRSEGSGGERATDWRTVPAFRLSADGWQRLPAADAIEESSASSPAPGSAASIRARMDRAESALAAFPGAAAGRAPSPAPPWPPQRRPTEAAEEESRVRVKIGRLEVTHPAPAVTPLPPRRRTPSPRLALDEYLQRRRVGRH